MTQRLLFIALLALTGVPGAARAQIVSPGPLTSAHRELEGLRQCTQCHELRQQGASRDRCLACHTPLRDRIARRAGLHGRMTERDCGACHKEHVGRDADIVRFDEHAFRHAETGFALRGAHGEAACRDCHKAELVVAPDVRRYGSRPAFLASTWLGLGSTCVDCHRTDDPHGDQFADRACADCHVESEWTDVARFDHARTDYALTGLHRDVECGDCHRARGDAPVRFDGLRAARCTDCHTDPHRGAMAGACEDCHSTRGWRSVDADEVGRRFDHARTRFPLEGGHSRIDCDGCHGRPAPAGPTTAIRFLEGAPSATFPKPASDSCRACHLDVHEGAFAQSGPECSRCHGVEAWTPVRFGIDRHAEETSFPLDGAHIALLCASCHAEDTPATAPRPAPAAGRRHVSVHFAVPSPACADCHHADDPHAGQFGDQPCGACHGTGSFEVESFDHAGARAGECRSCHAHDDPHEGEFTTQSCDACHAIEAFLPARFDHAATRFPLDGAHAGVACARCHRSESGVDGRLRVRYTGLSSSCAACHGGAP